MKTLVTVLALSLGAIMANSTMAASYDERYEHRYDHQHNRYQQSERHWDDRHHDRRYDDRRYDRHYNWNRVNPSRDWRVGQVFPRYFEQSRYSVNYRDYRRLTRPGRYQQWYRINGDYVLINERTNRIIRIID